MGRKIDIKKIENATKCQVTFSKRRSSLMKKANELSVCCDVEVAVVAFSPSGRVSRFATPNKIDEVLTRFVSLPPERRLINMSNVQAKVEKLNKLRHINGDFSKLHYLDKQVENLELQIKKRCLELQITETDLRDYEVDPEQDASLHHLLWCDRYLNLSLQRVIARKMELVQLEGQSLKSSPNNLKQKEQVSLLPQNPIPGQILMQLDPWISPYSAKVRDSIFQDLVDQALHPEYENTPPPLNITSEQPLMMDQQALFNQHDPNNVNAILKQSLMMDDEPYNFQVDQNNVFFSDAVHISTQNFSNIIQDPVPRSSAATNPNTTTGLLQSLYNEMGTRPGSNLMSQINNMGNNSTIFSNDNNPSIGDQMNNVGVEGLCKINTDNTLTQESYQPHDPYNVLNHHKEPCGDAHYDTGADVWTSNQENGSSWDWGDLLRDGSFDFPNSPLA